MNRKRLAWKLAVCGIAVAAGGCLAEARGAMAEPQASASAAADAHARPSPNGTEERKYEEGRSLLNDGHWAEAESAFRAVSEMHGPRAPQALYWQAYAENKMEHLSEALETCSRLRRTYGQSEWLRECGALEIEIRKRTGSSVSPQSEQDEELKSLALQALMQQDRPEAMPILRNILTGNHSAKLKEHALFLLTQSNTKEAQDILGSVARGQSGPELQLKAIQMLAAQEGKRASGLLDEVYRSSNDVKVKEAVLHSYLVSGDSGRLVDAARGETNQQLIRTAVHTLGAMGEADQLMSLYRSAKTSEAKAAIIEAFVPCGERANPSLREIATTEQDAQLRRKAIRNLGITGGHASGAMLVEIYQKNSDQESKVAAVEGLFVAGDAHDLVALARAEKDLTLKRKIVEKLSVMGSKESTDYMMELLK